jgi:hypothetical protein
MMDDETREQIERLEALVRSIGRTPPTPRVPLRSAPSRDRLEQIQGTIVTEMRATMSEVRASVSGLHSGMADVRGEIATLRAEMVSRFDNVLNAITDLRRDFNDHTHDPEGEQ